MLPELLFSVGSSMQDITHDELSLPNGSYDKETKTHQIPSMPPNITNDFLVCSNSHISSYPNSSVIDTSIIDTSAKLENNNNNNNENYEVLRWHQSNSNIKLECNKNYLKNSDDPLISRGATDLDCESHNELKSIVSMTKITKDSNKLSSLEKTNRFSGEKRSKRKGNVKLKFHHQSIPSEYLNHYKTTKFSENFKLINENNEEKQNKIETPNTNETVRMWLEKISEIQNIESDQIELQTKSKENDENDQIIEKCIKRTVNYSDLPYMGEITLENSKPRRGRKPKKADICHLIYKNYGTILPGTPKNLMEAEIKAESKTTNSLLAKRLSTNFKDIQNFNDENIVIKEEPLNLCVRDQSIESNYDQSESDETNTHLSSVSSRQSPIDTLISDTLTDSLLHTNIKMTQLNNNNNNNLNSVNWPSTGVFIHPMALYYQKMVNNENKINIKKEPIVVKNINSQINKINRQDIKSIKQIKQTPIKVSVTKSKQLLPTKRKRSAIFIPPMPAENTTSPATEVSICKFKFTGGAKPSLQEKKMLSVDADGNYRYYNGTGDKSMRGYEFFPRETLQQSGILPGVNCPSAFLNVANEKIISQSNGEISNNIKYSDNISTDLMFPINKKSFKNESLNKNCLSLVKKRKSKRSLQREKLEKTFKEKGFLIQTQQLESNEGATYCKFRQLRKFTRYLFRSWKDYLPGDLQVTRSPMPVTNIITNSNNGQETGSINGVIIKEEAVTKGSENS